MTLAQIAYRAYRRQELANNPDGYQPRPWRELRLPERQQWGAAALAVLEASRKSVEDWKRRNAGE